MTQDARQIWSQKLAFLLAEKAKLADANQRFAVAMLIREAKDKLAELDAAAPDGPSVFAVLHWPWGPQRLTGRLQLGRDLEFSPLADRLASFPNLSRRHAELWVADGALWVQDLGSMNRTFIDGTPLAPHHPQRLEAQVRVRFGTAADALELRVDCAAEPDHDD